MVLNLIKNYFLTDGEKCIICGCEYAITIKNFFVDQFTENQEPTCHKHYPFLVFSNVLVTIGKGTKKLEVCFFV